MSGDVEAAARALLEDFAKQHRFWVAEAERRHDTYTFVHRDLYRYYAEDESSPAAALRSALEPTP